ncbi:MAG TPA: DUF72 domain-containing protein [Rhizomicrobium sp.]|jgi:uncharacterized protein YecE (DUF72 family)|nr:DUF72 domain-containing protein [Rhizomicrobium sp.]
MTHKPVRIGTAGWSLPQELRARFGAGASILARYATALNAVEINSSFYRPHKPATYARWAETVPADFRFAVKVPKTITHEKRLVGCAALLDSFLAEVGALGGKLGPLLVQLPPTLKCDAKTVSAFLALLRERFDGAVVCEPRHASWFTGDADALLVTHRIARAAADPARVPGAERPGGDPGTAYFRWHGSPRMYYSDYEPERLAVLTKQLRKARAKGADVWCIFDNTAVGAATANALEMRELV